MKRFRFLALTVMMFTCPMVVFVQPAWTIISSLTSNDRHAVSFADSLVGTAVGENGTIFHLSTAEPLSPKLIRVPQDQPTIQAAIAFAWNGDTVLVSPGTYREQINFFGKNVVVASLRLTTGNGRFITETIIDPDSGSVVTFATGETRDAVLDGFTVTGGTGTVIDNQNLGGGILVRSASPTIRNNIIRDNSMSNGCANGGGGIAVKDSASPSIISNAIRSNHDNGLCDCICYFGGGIWVDSTSSPIIGGTDSTGNNIDSNTADLGRQIYRAGSGALINAQYNYWGSCPPDSYAVYPLSQFDVSHCLNNPIVGVREGLAEALPREFRLEQNYPNPFNPITDVRYTISDMRHVSLIVYDVLGREVVTLVNEVKQPGEYTVTWDASNMPSGIYFYKLQADKFVAVKKMLLAK